MEKKRNFFLLTIHISGFILIFYLSYININFQLDDALIYLRYVKNFLNGEGLVYNSGVYFNGLTSPLYSYLMILAAYITGIENLQFLSIALSVFSFSAAIYTSALVFFQKKDLWRSLLIVVLGAFPYFYLVYGMETLLFIFLIVLCLYFYQKNMIISLGISSALLLITRSEGIFLLMPIVYFYLKNKKKIPKDKYFIIPVIILSVNFIFNKFYYGSFLPSTGMAKIWQGKSGLWGDGWVFLDIKYLFAMVFNNNLLFLIALIAPLSGLFFKKIEEVDLVVLIFLIFYSCFYIFLNIPNYHWYYAPYFFFGLCYVVKGASCLSREIYPKNQLLATIIVLLPIVTVIHYSFQNSNVHNGPHSDYQKIGLWLKENTPTTARIAMVEIGTVGWYSDRYIIDILGLVNPYNARFIGEKKFGKWLEFYNPDYFLVHDPLWNHEISAKILIKKNWYSKDDRFKFPGYSLLKRTTQAKILINEQDLYIIQNSHGNLVPFTTTPPAMENLVIISRACALDTINGAITRISTVMKGDPLIINGWMADTDSEIISVPVIARLTRSDNSQVFYAIIVNRISRPDVATHFKNPALDKSGFDFTATLEKVPTGHYTLEFLQSVSGKLLLCADQGQITIQ